MTKYLDFYKKFLEDGELPGDGLCNSVPGIFEGEEKILIPTADDFEQLRREKKSVAYWGSDVEMTEKSIHQVVGDFTYLRRTLLLFAAAINNEL